MKATSQNSDILLKVSGVEKHYQMGNKTLNVLSDVNFSLKRGEIASILGISGAGKSTLLNIIGTLDKPNSGSVLLDGEDLTKYSESALASIRNKKIGFIFQFHYLLPEFTALENVAMPGLIQRLPRDLVFKRSRELLERVGMEGRLDHKPNELSGGELQRVSVARALINDPVLVLADEPTGNLDRANGELIYSIMLELSKKAKKTFLVVTHNETIADKTDRIFTLTDGKIV